MHLSCSSKISSTSCYSFGKYLVLVSKTLFGIQRLFVQLHFHVSPFSLGAVGTLVIFEFSKALGPQQKQGSLYYQPKLHALLFWGNPSKFPIHLFDPSQNLWHFMNPDKSWWTEALFFVRFFWDQEVGIRLVRGHWASIILNDWSQTKKQTSHKDYSRFKHINQHLPKGAN